MNRDRVRPALSVAASLLVLGSTALPVAAADAPARSFRSPLVTAATPGHAVDVEVDVTGARTLHLVVTDGGNGFACDWADWAEPRLSSPNKELPLTELKWKTATSGWMQPHVGKNAEGGPLKIGGKPVEYGIGTHANSVISYDLPSGFTRFRCRAGLDDGGTTQTTGASSVQFAVFVDEIPAAVLAQAGSKTATAQGGAAASGGEPADAVAALDVAEGLEATLFAAEPLLLSPSNIDVDARGRVWVCEVVNYRHRNGSRPEGDRILILEDTNGDGKADRQTVFYQGRDVDSALGIGVFGNKVIVSCAPNVFVFTDEDGDDKPDRKEVLFSKVGQPQHDHSTHAFVFGPDGRFYWNVGNTGQRVADPTGKDVVDLAGRPVVDNGKPYWGGMPFRCRLDGSAFEVLGHNFRNNFEVTVDSFGTLWQSDNDDDGNQGVRINYVMEYGNYGYKDEMTGAGWQAPRTNLESEKAARHWHLNDPGVVPNLLHTGAGSPTGICLYEGTLLPTVFRGQVIHCDAGPGVVRAYPAKRSGAGYSAEIVDVVKGTRDKWFRPSDVCVAPDGSLIVADWYDPGVGGHKMGDIDKGRLFRIAPPNSAYVVPKLDLATPAGAASALKSPNLATRYLAYAALEKFGAAAEPALLALRNDPDPRMQARALWVLGDLPGRAAKTVAEALASTDSDLRIVGLRLAREHGADVVGTVRKLVRDADPQVRRECAIALRLESGPEVPGLWADLAAQHDGQDRWALEALGIGSDRRADECFAAWKERAGSGWNTPAGRDIVWRSRSAGALPLLADVLLDPATTGPAKLRYFRAFDFHPAGQAKTDALLRVAFGRHPEQPELTTLALAHLGKVDASKNPALAAAIEKSLDGARGTDRFVRIVEQFGIASRDGDLVALAQSQPDAQLGLDAVRVLLGRTPPAALEKALAGTDEKGVAALLTALGTSADPRAEKLVRPLALETTRPLEVRRSALRALAATKTGALAVVDLAEKKQLGELLAPAAAAALHGSAVPEVRAAAARLFPLPPSKNDVPLPSLAQLLQRKGDARKGRVVYNTTGTCAKCHVIGKDGKEVGPNLTEIGDKLSQQAFYDSILYPSAGISHNFETWTVVLSSGATASGLLVSETAEAISLKGPDALVRTFPRKDVEERVKQPISLMPADLAKVLTADELVDLVEYLTTLRKGAPAAGAATGSGSN